MTVHLHFDLVGGIAGDMTVAALLDAGVEADLLTAALQSSGLPLTPVHIERTWRGGLAGTTFHVEAESAAPHRTWRDVRTLLETSRLEQRPRRLATAIFTRLAEAEAAVHGCATDDVHFHEVGAMDSIVDIVAASIAVDALDAESFSCGAVPVCTGTVVTEHGVLPLPAPATTHLLEGFTLASIPGDLETVTPTGAAILSTLCPGGDGPPPQLKLRASGAGLGTAELADRPNVLRVLVGELVTTRAGARGGDATVLEASIDDMDPRVFGAVAASLFAAGALDVVLVPIQMKKGRPGTLLQVLARPELEGVLSGIVLRETTTLGLRSHDVRRTELARRHETVETAFGRVRVKLGLLGDECVNVSPEYDDCAAVASARGVPVKEVLAAAVAAALAADVRQERR